MASDIAATNARIEAAFVRPAAGDLPGLIHYILASEIHGQAVFECLAETALDPDTQAFWAVMAKVEATTVAHLEVLARRHEALLPDIQAFSALGVQTAASFHGRTPLEYFDWVGPYIQPYLGDLRTLQAGLVDPADLRHAQRIVDHEVAIAECCALLPMGLAPASVPLRAHLAAA